MSAVATIRVLGATGLIVGLMQNVVFPAMPELAGVLDASPAAVSWLATGHFLAGAVATPLVGRLGDRWGRRAMLELCLAAMVAGSIVAALTSSFVPVLAGRTLQGVGVAAVPLSVSLLSDAVADARLGRSLAVVSAAYVVGSGVGLPLGGWLLDGVGWRSLFLVPAACGLAILVAVRRVLAESAVHVEGALDVAGAMGLGAWLTAALLPLSLGARWGWFEARTLGTAGAGTLGAAAWVAVERRRRHPIVDLDLLRSRALVRINLVAFLVGWAMFANFLGTLQLLMTERPGAPGLSAVTAGLALAPGLFVLAAAAPLAGRVSDRFGPERALVVGAALIALGLVARLVALDVVVAVLWWATVAQVGMAFVYGAMPTAIIRNTPPHRIGEANGVNMLARVVGASGASAALAAFVTGGEVATDHLGARFTVYFAAGGLAAALSVVAAASLLPLAHRRAEAAAP